MKRFINWLNASEVSNQMGGGYLTSFFRYALLITVIISLAIFIFKQ